MTKNNLDKSSADKNTTSTKSPDMIIKNFLRDIFTNIVIMSLLGLFIVILILKFTNSRAKAIEGKEKDDIIKSAKKQSRYFKLPFYDRYLQNKKQSMRDPSNNQKPMNQQR